MMSAAEIGRTLSEVPDIVESSAHSWHRFVFLICFELPFHASTVFLR
jgi:hypothetical protein